MSEVQNTTPSPAQPPAADQLDSWKDIATYLGREVRTVQGWEKNEGLPVHRHQHSRQGTVYAFKSEIDAWKKKRANVPVPEAMPVPAQASPSKSWTTTAVACGGVLLLVMAAFFLWKRFHAGGTVPSSVAVLAFVDMSPAKDQEYFSDGLTEEIIDALSRVPNVHVVARTSAFQFKGKNVDIREIGRQLNVTAVLEGSVRKEGDQLRITAQLNRVADGFHLWSRTYDRPLKDIFAMQREISQAIATQLGGGEVTRRESTKNLEAYRYYLQGRYAMGEPTEERIKAAIANYQQALAKDPNFALAYAGLADTFSYLGDEGVAPPKEILGQAKAAAQKALQLDSTIGEAHTSLGIVALLFEWDWPTAQKEFQRALELSPGNAYAHHWYGHYFDAMGRFDDGMAEMKRALDLDPLSEMFNFDYGIQSSLRRRWEPALAQYKKVLNLNPDNPFAHWGLAFVYERTGRAQESLAELKRLESAPGIPILMAVVGPAYLRLGKVDEARRILARMVEMKKKSYVPSFFEAIASFALNDNQQGFSYLEQAYEERSSGFTYLLPTPEFDGVRTDPRFVSIMHKVGIPDAAWSGK
jgi:TolB-like protein